jgi:hypothetical protein
MSQQPILLPKDVLSLILYWRGTLMELDYERWVLADYEKYEAEQKKIQDTPDASYLEFELSSDEEGYYTD